MLDVVHLVNEPDVDSAVEGRIKAGDVDGCASIDIVLNSCGIFVLLHMRGQVVG